jgi:hypothetical protein
MCSSVTSPASRMAAHTPRSARSASAFVFARAAHGSACIVLARAAHVSACNRRAGSAARREAIVANSCAALAAPGGPNSSRSLLPRPAELRCAACCAPQLRGQPSSIMQGGGVSRP